MLEYECHFRQACELLRSFEFSALGSFSKIRRYLRIPALFLRLKRIEFADGRSPPCERALLVRIERREPGDELGKGIGGLVLAGGGGQQIMPHLAHLEEIELRHCDPAADLELPRVR